MSDSTTKHLQNPNLGHRAIDPRSAPSNYDRPGTTIHPILTIGSNPSKTKGEQEIKRVPRYLEFIMGRDIAHLMSSTRQKRDVSPNWETDRPCPDG